MQTDLQQYISGYYGIGRVGGAGGGRKEIQSGMQKL